MRVHHSLPPVSRGAEQNLEAPQYGPVSWAYVVGRPALERRGEPPAALLVLTAAAHHAACASWAPDGYNGTRLADLQALLGLSPSTIRRYLRVHVALRLLEETRAPSGETAWRIPQDVWNGEWAR